MRGWSEQELTVYIKEIKDLTCAGSCVYSLEGKCQRGHPHGIDALKCFKDNHESGFEKDPGSDENEIKYSRALDAK